VVMTQKDAVKIQGGEYTAGWQYLRIAQRIVRGADEYWKALETAIRAHGE